MPRYALLSTQQQQQEPLYIAAYYESFGNGVYLTYRAEDACSYVTIEKAAQVAKTIQGNLGYLPSIVEVDY